MISRLIKTSFAIILFLELALSPAYSQFLFKLNLRFQQLQQQVAQIEEVNLQLTKRLSAALSISHVPN